MFGLQKYSKTLSQNFVEPIRAASIFEYVSTCFAHLEIEIFAHSLQNSSRPQIR